MSKEGDPGRAWGIPREATEDLGERLHSFWERFRDHFKTKTRDGSHYARHYLSGLLRMATGRHYAGVARESGIEPMSNSPWSAKALLDQVQDEIQARPELMKGGVLLVDESADEKASGKTAGAAKQYNGRMGKIETSQVGVFLCYVNLEVAQGFWTWIRGTLFCPKAWFAHDEEHKKLRDKLGIPDSLVFKTKIELVWDMIEAA
jgi:SRSO17 transposase